MPRPVFDMSSELGRAQAEISRLHREKEPTRDPLYRKLHTRIGVQDDCISWLLTELRALQKRVSALEVRHHD
jgi:hypothetical protein